MTFRDGIIVEVLNAKFLLVLAMMYSQFYTPDRNGIGQIFFLAGALVFLTKSSSMIWIVAGGFISTAVASVRMQRIQGFVFGSLLCAAALWFAMS